MGVKLGIMLRGSENKVLRGIFGSGEVSYRRESKIM
jgi:hypothetical protein